MKKSIIAFFSTLLLAVSAVAAPTMITIGSGSTTGVYYPIAVGVAKLINQNVPNMRANARSTGGSVYNALALGRGELQLGFIQSDIASYAYHGEVVEAFIGKPIPSLRGVMALYPEVVQIFASPKINSLEDLKGKRVYIGDIGSGNEHNAKQILALYGLTEKDIKPVRGSSNLGAQLIQDDRVDAMFLTFGIGNAAAQQVTETTNVHLLSVPADKAKTLIETYPFYVTQTIPANTYKGQIEAVPTVAVQAVVAATTDLPNEVVEAILEQALFKGGEVDDFTKLHSNLKTYFDLKEATEGMGVPIHPGAIAAFKALGVPIQGQ